MSFPSLRMRIQWHLSDPDLNVWWMKLSKEAAMAVAEVELLRDRDAS